MSTDRSASGKAPYRVSAGRGSHQETRVEQPHHSLPESASITPFPHWLRSQQLDPPGLELQQHQAHVHGSNVHVSQSYLPHAAFATSRYPTYRSFPQLQPLPPLLQPHRDELREVLLPPILSSSGAELEPRSKKPTTRRACQNCKQAHVRCDEEKPCTRCKVQHLDCVPAEQKKRGRPPRSSAHDILRGRRRSVHLAGGADNEPQVLADFAAHRSSFNPDLRPEPGIGQHPHIPFQTFSPVAFLDMRLTVMRVNESFQATFGTNMSLLGRHIGDLLEPEYRHLTYDLHQAVLNEKSTREASELRTSMEDNSLPQLPPDMDAVNIARVMAPFADRRFKMAFRLATGPLTMTVSFRLARANNYFVVLTLPDRRGHLPVYLMGPPASPEVTAATLRPSQPHPFAPTTSTERFSSSLHVSASAPASPHHPYGEAVRTRPHDIFWQPRPQDVLAPLPRARSFTPANVQSLLGNPYESQYEDQYFGAGPSGRVGSSSSLNPRRDYERLTPGQEPRRPRSAEVAQVLSRMAETGRPPNYRQPPVPQEAEPERREHGIKRRRDSPPVGTNDRPARRPRGPD